MILQVIATVVLGLMCGSELNVAAFGHPTIDRQPFETHVLMRSSFARLFGRIMPFWMAASIVLNPLLLFPFERLNKPAWRLAAAALVIQALAILFSLVGPVPINNRISKWTPTSVPDKWKREERLWDSYHWFRTSGLIIAFAVLVIGLGVR